MPTCALCVRLELVGINASSGRQGRVMTSDVPQVGLRQLSDNFQVLCPSALLPICAAGRFRRLMTRDVLAVQGVHIRCFPPISKHFQAHMIVANFLSVANVVIADFLSKPTSWSSLGNL